MSWRELRRSITSTIIILFFAITLFSLIGAARAETIRKLDMSLNDQQTPRTNLLGTPVRVAVGGGHVYLLTLRGWIFRFDASLADAGFARLPGPLVAPTAPRIPATALAVTATNVYAARFPNATGSSEIFHYDSVLSSLLGQVTMSGSVVGLTVDKDGYVYVASASGTISKLNADLTDLAPTPVTRTLPVPMGSSVKAIKAQTAPNGAVAIFVALSNGNVYRLDTSLATQANGSVTGTPANIAADTLGNVVVETSSGLYLTDYGINLKNSKSMTGLIGVDMDNSNNVAAANLSNVYAMKVTTAPTSLSSGTSISFSTTFTPSESIAIDAGSIYAVGGSPGASEGDPHLETIDGVRYDFQSAGEFVLLRHARDSKADVTSANVGAPNSGYDASEIQVRQFPVATTANTCVSLNSAIAAQVGKHTVTYEPNLSGEPDTSGLQLRIDHKLVALDQSGIRFGDGGRVVPTSASGGLEIDFPNDDILFVTPGWWDSQRKWYLNVNVVPQQRGGGLVGDVPEGSWLPALPDGTSMGPAPTSPHERYVALYERFADAWRVTDKTSLFDYAPGTSTKTFTTPGWPPETGSCSIPGMVPVEGTTEKVAREVCKNVSGDPANCIFDVKVTGLINIANTYVASRNAQPVPETKTQPEPRCANWRTIALLVVLGVLVLLALWILLSRRRGG